eukprot:4967839-Prymnesium_polylepis.2
MHDVLLRVAAQPTPLVRGVLVAVSDEGSAVEELAVMALLSGVPVRSDSGVPSEAKISLNGMLPPTNDDARQDCVVCEKGCGVLGEFTHREIREFAWLAVAFAWGLMEE